MNQQSETNSTVLNDDLEIPLQVQHSLERIPTQQPPQTLENSIIVAAQGNDKSTLERLLRTTTNLNLATIRNHKGFTVLHFAAFNNSYEMIILIITYYNAAINQELNDIMEMRQFVNQQTTEGFGPLHFAAYRGNIQIMDKLVELGADVQLKNNQNMNMMHIGAQGDQPNSIIFARDKGLSINDLDVKGGTPLHWACFYGQEQASLYLLTLVEKDPPYYPLNVLDSQQLAPLHLAVMSGNTKLVKRLLVNGAQKDLKGRGDKTAAEIAIDNEYKNIHNLITKERNCLIAYFNIKQAVRRIRRSIWELLKFMGLMLLVVGTYLIYAVDSVSLLDYIIIAISIVMFSAVVMSNPGYQKKRPETLLQLLRNQYHDQVCPVCNIVRLPRSRHCEICQKCVMVYDHHCPWINNCIGAGNHFLFILFIITLDVSIIYILVNTIIALVHDEFQTDIWLFDCVYIKYLLLTIQMCILVMFTLGITLLIVTQTTNILLGQTTFERFAIQNNSSTLLKSQSPRSVQTSLLSDSGNEQPNNKRFKRYQFRNCITFCKNYKIYRQKENAIRIIV